MSEDVAWCAGFFEGEGHISFTVRKRDNASWLSIAVAQVHREPLDKFAEVLGGKVYGPYGPYSTNKKAYFMYQAYGKKAESAARTMRPYLYHKGEQVDVALVEYENHNA